MRQNKSLTFKIVFSSIVIISLIAVRLFEREWFPEAFQDFFSSGRYLTEDLPSLHPSDYFSVIFRYAVNSVFSIVLLYIWFPDRPLIRFIIKIYLYSGIILFVFLGLVVYFYHPGRYTALFYIRRFMIQPLWLFVLFPVLFAMGYGSRT